jgi:hypothetical protein
MPILEILIGMIMEDCMRLHNATLLGVKPLVEFHETNKYGPIKQKTIP